MTEHHIGAKQKDHFQRCWSGLNFGSKRRNAFARDMEENKYQRCASPKEQIVADEQYKGKNFRYSIK